MNEFLGFLLTAVACGFLIKITRQIDQQKKERKRQEEEQRRRQVEEQRRRIIEQTNEYFENFILKGRILFDSNIWMNRGYDAFFLTLQDQIQRVQSKIELYGPQFDEICNIKKRTKYNSYKNASARCAINRIEELQMKDLLQIKPLTIEPDEGAYADPLIIKLILKLINNNEKVVLISDDIELRIRMRGLLPNDKRANCVVLPGQELINKSIEYCSVKELRYEKAKIEDYYSLIEEQEGKSDIYDEYIDN